MTTTIAPIRITGDEAAELARHTRFALADPHAAPGTWTEIQTRRECDHGCKLHARRRGAVTQFRLFHSSTYGCALGRHPETRDQPVSVAPKAQA